MTGIKFLLTVSPSASMLTLGTLVGHSDPHLQVHIAEVAPGLLQGKTALCHLDWEGIGSVRLDNTELEDTLKEPSRFKRPS